MVKYIALEKIDGYKIGDVVPTEKAVVWEKMYLKSPVEKVEEKTEKPKVEKPKVEKPKVEKKKGIFSK